MVLPYIDMNPPQVYMCSPSWTSLPPPPHPIPLGHPSAPAPSTLSHALNLDWQFISHMIIYMFQCHSPKSSHPRNIALYSIRLYFHHQSHLQLGVFLLWLHLFILSGVISPLISSSIVGTYRPGEFIFQCPIFLPFHAVHGVLKARILKRFAVSFSRGPRFVRTFHHDPCVLDGP